MAIPATLHRAINKKIIQYDGIFLHSLCSLLDGKATVSGLVFTFENNSRKRTAPVTDTFFASWGCPRTRASTVFLILVKITYKRDRERRKKGTFQKKAITPRWGLIFLCCSVVIYT